MVSFCTPSDDRESWCDARSRSRLESRDRAAVGQGDGAVPRAMCLLLSRTISAISNDLLCTRPSSSRNGDSTRFDSLSFTTSRRLELKMTTGSSGKSKSGGKSLSSTGERKKPVSRSAKAGLVFRESVERSAFARSTLADPSIAPSP